MLLRLALGLAFLLVCTVASGQEQAPARTQVEFEKEGRISAMKFVQIYLMAHIAQRDGVGVAKHVVSLARRHFSDVSSDPPGQSDKYVSELFKSYREGGYSHLNDLELLIADVERRKRMKSK